MLFWVLTILATGALIAALQSAARGDLAEAFGALAFGFVFAALAALASRDEGEG